MSLRIKPMTPPPTLDALIGATRDHVMTPEEIRAQRISWVAGELGIEHPELSPEECRKRAEEAERRR